MARYTIVPERSQVFIEASSSLHPINSRTDGLEGFVDTRRYPTIDGRLTALRDTGRDGRYVVRGDLTFREVTNTYEDEMTIVEVDDETLQLKGHSTFDIRDFGMEPPRRGVRR